MDCLAVSFLFCVPLGVWDNQSGSAVTDSLGKSRCHCRCHCAFIMQSGTRGPVADKAVLGLTL